MEHKPVEERLRIISKLCHRDYSDTASIFEEYLQYCDMHKIDCTSDFILDTMELFGVLSFKNIIKMSNVGEE